MAFPAADTHQNLAEVTGEVLRFARGTRQNAMQLRDELAAGSVGADRIIRAAGFARSARDFFNAAAAIPGIGAYLAGQLTPAKTAGELSSDLSVLTAALQAVITRVDGDLPASYPADPPLVDGMAAFDSFTPVQTANLRTDLQSVIDAIES